MLDSIKCASRRVYDMECPFLHISKAFSFVVVEHRPHGLPQGLPTLPRNASTSEFMPVGDKEVEYFFASDASAVIEHTNRVIYLEVNLDAICIMCYCYHYCFFNNSL